MSNLKRLWVRLGRVTFWLSWPALWLYLRGSQRTRLLLVCGDEVLVLRGWLSDGRWELPGGGRHRRETPADGLRREVREETGLQLQAGQLQSLGQAAARHNGFSFSCHVFACRLEQKPELRLKGPEILEAKWLPLSEVDSAGCDPIIKEILSRWQATL